LASLLDLGSQTLTGVFPKSVRERITSGPLELVKCQAHGDSEACGLVQLAHTYPKEEMYGDNYGYHSSLNKAMTDHLTRKAERIQKRIALKKGDIIVDIGSNDASFLKNFGKQYVLVGIDPTGLKFKQYYPDHISLVPRFFDAAAFRDEFPDRKAKVVTSFAMFYDLEAPREFVSHVHDILADDGIWVIEQSYLPTMLDANAYDTICHEHAEYYCLSDIKWMADRANLKIIDIEFNDVNGGSFSVTFAKKNAPYKEAVKQIASVLAEENMRGMHTNDPVVALQERLSKSKEELLEFLHTAKKEGKTVMGYGASTKGNVLLQYCGITEELVPYIGEVNPNKFGCFTPFTHIPIIPESEVRAMKPEYMLVLPWHFRNSIVAKEKKYLDGGGTLVFPLPKLDFVGGVRKKKSIQVKKKPVASKRRTK
jgi:NDP-4-keto-2,6-dideoxyhexose 3-C-methyltransferase